MRSVTVKNSVSRTIVFTLFLVTCMHAAAQSSPLPPLDFRWAAQAMPHVIGRSDGDGWSAHPNRDSAGFLQFGPYATNASAGDNIAVWRLQVGGRTDGPVVRLEVNDADTNAILAARDIYYKQWDLLYDPFVYQDIAVPFRLDTSSVGHHLEYRVWWYKNTYVKEQFVGFANESKNTTSRLWNAQNLPHLIGRADGTGWAANTAQDRPNYLQYGPYTTDAPAGDNIAIWRLMIDNNSADNRPIARLEVSDYEFNTVLASREITRQQWAFPNVYQDFLDPFTVNPSNVRHHLEYRVYWYGHAYLREQEVRFANENSSLQWNAQRLPHVIGRADGAGWSANTAQDGADFLQYGPYTTSARLGNNLVVWRLQIDNNNLDNLLDPIVRLDVNDATTNTILAAQDVFRKQWAFPFDYEYFALPFSLDNSRMGHVIEYRVYWYKTAYVKEQAVGTR